MFQREPALAKKPCVLSASVFKFEPRSLFLSIMINTFFSIDLQFV